MKFTSFVGDRVLECHEQSQYSRSRCRRSLCASPAPWKGLTGAPRKLAGRFTSGRAKPSRNCAPTSPRSWTRKSPRRSSPLKRRSARWRPKRRASHQRRHGRSPSRLRRRACPMATIFNPATMGSRLHRTEMIGRRLCRADKHQYSCRPRPMTATTPISRPSRLAELTAPIIITMISRARAGGAVSSS